jgi:hypothetical protein
VCNAGVQRGISSAPDEKATPFHSFQAPSLEATSETVPGSTVVKVFLASSDDDTVLMMSFPFSVSRFDNLAPMVWFFKMRGNNASRYPGQAGG